ncbi:ribulose-phosphate 3-epimerase [Verminephrobacter aporrectodeae subsp. tuberculatae]|nr:ribulose-phosphate 3-epimerase [Verminephrobacter aporrectodeae subsp. tuberculatae]
MHRKRKDCTVNSPCENWFHRLPDDRLIAEFSVWSADLLRIGEELARIRPCADVLHVDVADGHFAPALLFFPDLAARVRAASDLPMHVHLMVGDAILAAQIDQFADAGADAITLHAECASVASGALDRIRRRGILAGLALKVETPVSELAPYIGQIHFLTLLGTPIGVKGRGLHGDALERLKEVRELVRRADVGHRVVVVADGGIRHETVPGLRAAGAQAVVLGSLAFGDPDLAARMQWLAAQ